MSSMKGVAHNQFTDGLSQTIMIGEKHVPLDRFGVGWWDCSLYNGHYYHCSGRPAGPAAPLARTLREQGWRFGSYHPGICQFSFGDGSVRALHTNISGSTLGLLAHRSDGEVIREDY